MKNWGKTVVAGLLLLTTTAQAETTKVPLKVPLIVSDKCNIKPDENGAKRCETRYSDGSSDVYWVKNGKIYWHYPIDNRVPSGGNYKPKTIVF